MADNDHIIAAATGYSAALIEPFLRSLKRIGFSGTLHLLVKSDELSRNGAGLLNGLRVRLYRIRRPRNVHVNRIFRCLQMLPLPFRRSVMNGVGSGLLDLILQEALPVCSYRYCFAYRLVSSNADCESVCLLTDSRDVYFQADPFRAYRNRHASMLVCAREDRCLTRESIDYHWLSDIYGVHDAENWLGKPISCSGTTLGNQPAMRAYLEQMTNQILRYRVRISHTVGYDQGIHNHLLFGGLVNSVVFSDIRTGILHTVRKPSPYDEAGYVRDAEARIVPVIHQFDRAIEHFRESRYFRELVVAGAAGNRTS